jgi:hypothetical protein
MHEVATIVSGGRRLSNAHVMTETTTAAAAPTLQQLTVRHFRFGWGALCTFVLLGAVLDSLHAFKIGFYLDVGAETRRFMWTLAHAHGLGFGLLHLGQAATLRADFWRAASVRLRLASSCLIWASVLMPLGFFLGGIATHGSDPSIGVFLVPIGGLVLLVAVTSTALEVFQATAARSERDRS